MAEIKVSTSDIGVLAGLARLKTAISDMKPVFEAIGAKLEQNVNIRFDTKTDPAGQPWQAWAPSTSAARKREGRGTLLEYTGRMRDSLTYEAGSDFVEIGFGVPYAKYHEQGQGVPRRQMLLDGNSLSKQDTDDVFNVIFKQLKQHLTQ